MKLDKLNLYSIITTLFFIAVYTALNNIGFIALSILLIIHAFYSKSFPLKLITTNGFIFISLFVLQSLSLLYSNNTEFGIKQLEGQLWLLIIPILLIFTKEDEDNFIKFQKFFFFGGCFSIALAFIYGIVFFDFNKISNNDFIIANIIKHFTYHDLAGYVGNHALYYSCYLSFSTIIGLNIFFNQQKNSYKKYYLIAVSVHVIVIFLLKSTTITLGFVICFLMFLLNHIDIKSVKTKLYLSFLSSVICAVFMHIILLKARYYNNHYFDSADFFQFYLPIIIIGLFLPFGIIYILHQKRMVIFSITFFIFLLTSLLALNYLKNHPEKLDYKNNYTNINARYGKWLSAVNIIKQKPFLGSGIGDRQDDLIKQYKVIDFPKAISAKYNEHNQYLRYWLDSGVLSFLLFLFLIFFNFKRGFINKDYTLISLCILLATFSMTESCLIRQKGIIFFVFVFCLYDKRNYRNLVT